MQNGRQYDTFTAWINFMEEVEKSMEAVVSKDWYFLRQTASYVSAQEKKHT